MPPQVVRAVMNSLITHIYMPWLNSTLLAPVNKDSRPLLEAERLLTIIGQALITTANWWSSVTNILASVSQFDLAVTTLVAGLLCDAELSIIFLRFRKDSLEKLLENPQAETPTQADTRMSKVITALTL